MAPGTQLLFSLTLQSHRLTQLVLGSRVSNTRCQFARRSKPNVQPQKVLFDSKVIQQERFAVAIVFGILNDRQQLPLVALEFFGQPLLVK